MMGRPSVTLMPSSKLAYFSTGRPWSWYIASCASEPARTLRVNRVSAGSGPDQVHALGAQRVEHRRDHVDFLAAQVAAFAGMRIEAGDQDARLGDAELRSQVAHAGCAGWWSSSSRVIAAGTSFSGRWVVASATRRPPSPAGQHHHHVRRVRSARPDIRYGR